MNGVLGRSETEYLGSQIIIFIVDGNLKLLLHLLQLSMAINAGLSRCVLGKKYGVLLIQHGVAAHAKCVKVGGFRVKSSPSFLRCILVRIGKEIRVAKGWALGPW